MKTINIKFVSVTAGLILVFILSSFYSKLESADASKDSYLILRTFEAGGQTNGEDNKIIISHPDGRIESVPLSKGKGSIEDNLKIINSQINSLSAQGYEFISATSPYTWTTTYVFKKNRN